MTTKSNAAILAMTPEERQQAAIRERMTTWPAKDVVAAWYRADPPFELTAFEDSIRMRWDWVKARFLARDSWGEIVKSLEGEFRVSVATARRDVTDALGIFGDLDKVPKEAHRQRAIEMTLKAYKVAEAKENSGDMSKATKVYVLACGLDQDDQGRIDIEKLMAERIYVEALDPMVRNFILNLQQQGGGVLDISKIFEGIHATKDGQDFTDFEEVEAE